MNLRDASTNVQIRLVTLAFKLRGHVTRSPKLGISGPKNQNLTKNTKNTKRVQVIPMFFFNKVNISVLIMKLNDHKLAVLTFTVGSSVAHITGTLIAQHGSTTGSSMLTRVVHITGNLI